MSCDLMRTRIMHKELWDCQVTRGKCVAKSCFDIQENNFGRDQKFFTVTLLQMDLGNVDTWKMLIFV